MSYESPIMVFSREKLREMQDDAVFTAILEIGVKVDKDELIKAIEYDRDQYDKGYQDGYNADKWISITNAYPDGKGKFLCLVKSTFGTRYEIRSFAPKLSEVDSDFVGEDCPGFYYFDREHGLIEDIYVTHWMPLPEKPKTKGDDN